MGGDVTIHLFRISESKLNNITGETELAEISKSIELKKELSALPEPVEIILSEDKVGIRYEFLGEPIVYQDPETRELKTVRPLKTAFSIVHFSTGLTEVRIYERIHALNVIKVFKQYFGGEYEILKFTREHLGQWLEWATHLRNARFKPKGPISTLYMGAKGWRDLRDIDLFREWWRKGEPVEGIYIKFEYAPKEEVGFGINAKMGKIMFRTFASEEEIKLIIDQAGRILEI